MEAVLRWPEIGTLCPRATEFQRVDEGREPDPAVAPRVENTRVYLRRAGHPLRVALEIYPDGEVVALLVGDPSICAAGSSPEEAIAELIRFMETDLVELERYQDHQLTDGAKARRDLLRQLLGR